MKVSWLKINNMVSNLTCLSLKLATAKTFVRNNKISMFKQRYLILGH